MQALFIMYYFEMVIMVYNAHISLKMVYKALLWRDVFWISYIKLYKFYNNLLDVTRSKQGGTLYNVFILKSVSITNISIEYYMWVILDNNKKQAENEKQTFFEILYWVVFQFFMQKYYIWQNNTFWCGISTKNTMWAGYAERSIK